MEASKVDDDIGADERHFKREVAKPLGALSIVIIMLSVDEVNPVKVLCSYLEGRLSQSTVATAAFILLTLLVIDQAENLIYWGARLFFRSTLNNIFFKSVEIVGAENIPKKGPIILTGNHNNQFVDGIMLLTNCHRDICFMIAEKSWNRPFVGFWARVFKCIPVARAQDMAFRGVGTVSVADGRVTGVQTKFLKDIGLGSQLQFAKDERLYKVKEVISDTLCTLQLDEGSEPVPSLEGVPYKVLPKVDQSAMYNAVHQGLGQGQCLGIFPEGGSHDRTDLLPLKAGVAIIALDAFRLHQVRVPIIPVGLNYYRGHRFRGRVVIEFGAPEYIPDALYASYEADRRGGAVETLLAGVSTAMRSVIVPAPNYRSLQLIYMVRRLYAPEGRKLTSEQNLDLTRRFAAAYRRIIKETERAEEETQTSPGGQEALAVGTTRKGEEDLQISLSPEDVNQLLDLKGELEDYISTLKRLGLRDHQVSMLQWRTMADVIGRLLYLGVCMTLGAIPQLMFNLPVMMLAQWLASQEQKKALASSKVKLAARDVVMSYTIIYCLCFVPGLYFAYAVLLLIFSGWSLMSIGLFLSLCPLFSLFGVKASEQGIHAYADILPMFLRLSSACRKEQDSLPARRFELRGKVRKTVKQVGPRLGDLYYQKDVDWRKEQRRELSPLSRGDGRGGEGDNHLRSRPAPNTSSPEGKAES